MSQLSRDAIAAQLEAAPQTLAMNQQQLPAYAQLYQDIQNQQAPQSAKRQIAMQKEYTPQLIDLALAQIKQSDPTGFAAREALGQKVLGDLSLGGSLSPEEQRLAEQDVRAGQQSRGLGTGLGDVMDESRYLGAQRFGREQQRMSNVSGFLSGKGVAGLGLSPQMDASAPQVNQFASVAPTSSQLMGLGMQGAQQNAANTMAMNALANNQYQFNTQNTTNPFLTGLSAFGSFISPIAGSVLGGAGGKALWGGDGKST